MQTPAGRVTFLDGLRGLAALCVVFCHCAAAFFPEVVFGGAASGTRAVLYGTPILNLPFQGNFMVCVFYTLSGLALSHAAMKSGKRSVVISSIVRRYPRLMLPALAGVLLSAILLWLSLYPVPEAARLSGSKWWSAYLSFPPSLLGALHEGAVGIFQVPRSRYDPPLWTMHNELLGSFLVFAVLLVAPTRQLRTLAYCLLVLFLRSDYLLAFVGGMAICEAWLARGDRPSKLRLLLVPLGVYGLLLGSYPIPSETTPDFYRQITPSFLGVHPLTVSTRAHVLGSVLLVAMLTGVDALRRPLESRVGRFLGRVSFALYIVHFLVLSSAGAAVFLTLHDAAGFTLAASAAVATVLLVSVAVAWLFTIAIDEPVVAGSATAYRWMARRFATLRGVTPTDRAPAQASREAT